MMYIEPEIETTADGSPTLRHPILGETYHSVRGAVGESLHVYIAGGLNYYVDRIRKELIDAHMDAHVNERIRVNVLEVGFGSGLNAWLTMNESAVQDVDVFYTAIEMYPVAAATLLQLEYADDPRYMEMHNCSWNEAHRLSDSFTLKKIECDLEFCRFDTKFDIVYFDAFAPDCQPQLWSEAIFAKLADSMNRGAVLVTYCAKGDVKRALRSAGFEVHRLEGALGKHHMLRATKM